MICKSYKTKFLLSVLLFFAATNFADQNIGRLLEEAMAARKNATVSEVSDRFMVAADAAGSDNQRANVLFIFSDYLMDMNEWEKVIQTQYQIINLRKSLSQAGAYYNIIRANLELNKLEDARSAAVLLNSFPSGQSMSSHARTMKELAPDSIHARISDMIVAASLKPDHKGFSQLETRLSSSANISTDNFAAQPLPETKISKPDYSRHFSVVVGGWQSLLRGDLNSQGSSLDFEDDLSSSRKTSLLLTAEMSPNSKDSFKATYVNFSFKGSLKKTFVHDSRVYNPGAKFDIRNMFIDLGGYRGLKQQSNFFWGGLYGIILTDSNLKVAQDIPGTRQITNWHSRFGYPYLGLAARSNHSGNIGWEASCKIFVWNGDGRYKTRDLEFKFIIGKGSRKIAEAGKFSGYLGYRDFNWDGDFGEDAVRIKLSGPIVGVEIYF